MRRWGLLALIVMALIWPVGLLAASYQAGQSGIDMPTALTIMSVLATIIVAVIKLVPAKPPLSINITWPEKVPEHDHPEYVPQPFCNLARENMGREIGDIKKSRAS